MDFLIFSAIISASLFLTLVLSQCYKYKKITVIIIFQW